MSDFTPELLARFDPTRSYNIQTPQKEFAGKVHRTSFVDGHAFVEGLPKSATDAQKVQLAGKLAYFADRGYHIEPSKRPVRDE